MYHRQHREQRAVTRIVVSINMIPPIERVAFGLLRNALQSMICASGLGQMCCHPNAVLRVLCTATLTSEGLSRLHDVVAILVHVLPTRSVRAPKAYVEP